MPLRKELDIWPNFVELTERRNLFVHSDGIVNRQYILNCTNASYKLPDDLKLGDHLRVAPDYYDRSCDCVAELGVKLAYVLWSKLLPNDKEKADESAISTIYDFLHVREYRLAEILARFLISPPFKHSCYESTLILTINLAIALRGQDKHDEVKSLINGIDWTALSLKFKLASKTLLEEYDEAASIMRAIGQSGDVSKLSYHQWPLFRWFRRSDQFKSAYQDVFEEPFKIIQQKNSSNSNEDSAESETPADESTSQG